MKDLTPVVLVGEIPLLFAAHPGVRADSPAGLPEAIVEHLNTEVNAVLGLPDVQARLQEYGANAGGGTPRQLAERMAADRAKRKQVIDSAGITMQ